MIALLFSPICEVLITASINGDGSLVQQLIIPTEVHVTFLIWMMKTWWHGAWLTVAYGTGKKWASFWSRQGLGYPVYWNINLWLLVNLWWSPCQIPAQVTCPGRTSVCNKPGAINPIGSWLLVHYQVSSHNALIHVLVITRSYTYLLDTKTICDFNHYCKVLTSSSKAAKSVNKSSRIQDINSTSSLSHCSHTKTHKYYSYVECTCAQNFLRGEWKLAGNWGICGICY